MATTQSLPLLAGRPAGLSGRLRCRIFRLLAAFAGRGRIARERRHLEALDDRQLRDIGLTRHQAMREARRHFWD
jgi:uncharacterized protein YjiS (DUF1127 family)